jgi:hypothetical protein
LRRIEAGNDRAFERREGGAEDLDSLLVRASHELTQARLDLLRAHLVRQWCGRTRMADVIDAKQDDHISNARLGQHVAIEARESRRGEQVPERRPRRVKDAVSDDPLI